MIVQGVSSYQTRDESLPGFLNFLVLWLTRSNIAPHYRD
jgi:hypothetical protein